MKATIGLAHYSYHPVIGGVERVMRQHAAAMVARGYAVKVLCGTGETTERDIEVTATPLLCPDDPLVAAAMAEQQSGSPGPAHRDLVEAFLQLLRRTFAGCDTVILHNLLTMHFNLACTEAIWRWASDPDAPRLVHWTHDLAAINPDFALGKRVRQAPWELLAKVCSGVEYVAVSETRRREFHELMGPTSEVAMVPNPLDLATILPLPTALTELLDRHAIRERELVLLHPTRVLKRKNIELTIRLVEALRQNGVDAVALITGAPDPYNAASRSYGESLLAMRGKLGLGNDVLFLRESLPLDDATVGQLFNVADLLFFPSRQEGFGLPVIEAAYFRIPAAVADLPVLREIAQAGPAMLFDPAIDAETLAKQLRSWLEGLPTYRWRREILQRHLLGRIWEKHLRQYVAPGGGR